MKINFEYSLACIELLIYSKRASDFIEKPYFLRIELIAEDQYKIDQVQQIFRTHIVKRKLSTGAFNFSKVEDARGGLLRQNSKIIQGIEREISQLINKTLKNSKLKVQVSIRDDELRVSGNKRDTLQTVIQMVKDLKILQPLQFINFRD